MIETIALATLAYGVFLVFVLGFLTATKRGDEVSDNGLPKAQPAELEREKHHSVA